jgi:hypothetical protein
MGIFCEVRAYARYEDSYNTEIVVCCEINIFDLLTESCAGVVSDGTTACRQLYLRSWPLLFLHLLLLTEDEFHKIKSWHGFERCTQGRTIALRKTFGDGTNTEKCPHAKTAKNIGKKENSAAQTLR